MRTAAWTVFEVLCLLCAFVGVWLIYPPAALILGGLVGAAVAEQATAKRPKPEPKGGAR